MNSEEIMFEQYKLYSEQKEKFVDRSFITNKFYLVLLLLVILAMFLTKDCSFVYGISSLFVFSAAGLAICLLWWINVDSYNVLIKVKLSKVLEDMEKSLPFKPYTKEFIEIKNVKTNQKEFLFADIQKTLSILFFLLFFFVFSYELWALIFN